MDFTCLDSWCLGWCKISIMNSMVARTLENMSVFCAKAQYIKTMHDYG